MGLFRTVRTLVREYLNFGSEEVTQLKQQLEKQRAQLQQLKVMREQRQQQEEKIALLELRRAVQQMESAEKGRSLQEEAVVEAVGKLSDKMQKVMESEMEEKAAGIMQSIDFQEVLTGIPDNTGEGAAGLTGSDSKEQQKPSSNSANGSSSDSAAPSSNRSKSRKRD